MFITTINSNTYFFNLSNSDLVEMEYLDEGFKALSNRIAKSTTKQERADVFVKVVKKAFGKKSFDGKLFYKNDDQTDDFLSSKDGKDFIELLSTDSSFAVDFVKGVVSM